MWWAIGLAALYVMHRVSRPVSTPMPAAIAPGGTGDAGMRPQSKWEEEGSTVEMNPFWGGEGGPADPFLLKLPPTVAVPLGGGGAGAPGGGGSGGGGGGAGGGGGRLK